jgi:hypothetical protein
VPAMALHREVQKLRAAIGLTKRPGADRLAPFRADPARLMSAAGIQPDPWQAETLRATTPRTLLLCCRQAGKSSTAAALALREVMLAPRSLVLLLSPTLRQSGELYRKMLGLYIALGRPVPLLRETALTLELENGSRVVSLPENESGVRGYSGARMIVIDEASRVSDDLYFAVRPMLAVSRGSLVLLSTPFGSRGVFHREWQDGGPEWRRVKITATDCPRITPEFLAEERTALGDRWFRQEYFCSFEDAVDMVFAASDIEAAITDDVQPLFPGCRG